MSTITNVRTITGPCRLCGQDTSLLVPIGDGETDFLCLPCGKRLRETDEQLPADNNHRAVDRRRWNAREQQLAPRCAGTGAHFVGIQENALGKEDLVLFNDAFGYTLALPISLFTPAAIRQVLAANQERWGKA